MSVRDKRRKPSHYTSWSKLLDQTPYVPSCSDKIAIVGAGPAGLHMAFLLKEIGFNSITLLESTDRASGKSFTNYTAQPDTPHEFGTCYTVPFKYQELRRVANVMGYEDFIEVPVPERTIYYGYGTGRQYTQNQYLVSRKIRRPEFQAIENETIRFLAAFAAVARDMSRYIHHHELLFKLSSPEVLVAATAGTFEEYLTEHNFEDLIPLLSIANTGQGYGYISTIPALYGLWWNDAHLMEGFLFSGIPIPGITVEEPASILRFGFEKFWEYMITTQSFDIRYNVDIESMNRTSDTVQITYTDAGISGGTTTENFDFVIVTSNLKECLDFINPNAEEALILGALGNMSNLSTTLVTVDHKVTQTPISTWVDGLMPEHGKSLMTIRNSDAIFKNFDNFRTTSVPDKDFLMCYQYQQVAGDDSLGHQDELKQNIKTGLEDSGYTNVEFVEQHIWPYFTRWDQEGLNQLYPVTLMRRQGTKRTWFCGASAIFESVHDVMELNIMLVNKIRAKLNMKAL